MKIPVFDADAYRARVARAAAIRATVDIPPERELYPAYAAAKSALDAATDAAEILVAPTLAAYETAATAYKAAVDATLAASNQAYDEAAAAARAH